MYKKIKIYSKKFTIKNITLSGVDIQSIAIGKHEIIRYLLGKDILNLSQHLENIYTINFIKLLILSKKFCLQ